LGYEKPPKSIKWRDAERTIKALGAVHVRDKGDHKHYKRKTKKKTYVIQIPVSNDIDGDLLNSIIRQTGVSKKAFWNAYYKRK